MKSVSKKDKKYFEVRVIESAGSPWLVIGYVRVYVIIESDCFSAVRLDKLHTGT